MKAAAIFRDALQAVKIMHDGSWLHRDLKPGNIGIVGTPARSVLLDLGTAIHIQPGATLQPEPGLLGTVGYLAPELELMEYNQSIDIWAMGVILYYLTYGRHPWNFAINPWRDNKENEKLRPAFQKSYLSAVNEMAKDYKNACQSPTDEYLHRRRFNSHAQKVIQANNPFFAVGGLFVEMVRYQWASKNHERRPDIDEVLQHPAWGSLLPESSQVKRRRHEL
jgi:serine/threonine protein kinase